MNTTRDKMANARKRFRAQSPCVDCPLWSVLDDECRTIVALTWNETLAKNIAQAMCCVYSLEPVT